MKIQKEHWLAVLVLALLFICVEMWQYKDQVVSAVATGIPNPGHAWTSIECNADNLCIDTVNNRLGIGTNNPTAKLDVNGVINVNSNKITNVALPTADADAATKAYVDAAGGDSMVTYATCYILNKRDVAGLTCDSGYTTIASYNPATCAWTTNSLIANNAVFITFGVGGSSTWWEIGSYDNYSNFTANINPVLLGGYQIAAIKTPAGLVAGSSAWSLNNSVCSYTAYTFALCCK